MIEFAWHRTAPGASVFGASHPRPRSGPTQNAPLSLSLLWAAINCVSYLKRLVILQHPLHTSNVERSYGCPFTRPTIFDILPPRLQASQPETAKSMPTMLSTGYFSRTLLNFVCQVDEVINESLMPIIFRRTVDKAA